ncbi:MAG: hypothetical protein MI923_16050 [Phycisphaerales bacterium]|nr:hypothetical protein [Phycisphaerales bacterium]
MIATKKKKRKPFPALSKTKQYFEKLGYRVAIVERDIRHDGKDGKRFGHKVDAWGFADLLAFHLKKPGMLALQATASNKTSRSGNMSEHWKKILRNVTAYEFLLADPNNRIGLMCWSYGKNRGDRHTYKFNWIKCEHFENLPVGAECEFRPKKRRRVKKQSSLVGAS